MYIISDADFSFLSETWEKQNRKMDEVLWLLMNFVGVTKVQSVRVFTAFGKNGAEEFFLGRFVVVKKGFVIYEPAADKSEQWMNYGGIVSCGTGVHYYATRCFHSPDTYFDIRRNTHTLKVSWGDKNDAERCGELFLSETRWVEMSQWFFQWLPPETVSPPRMQSSR